MIGLLYLTSCWIQFLFNYHFMILNLHSYIHTSTYWFFFMMQYGTCLTFRNNVPLILRNVFLWLFARDHKICWGWIQVNFIFWKHREKENCTVTWYHRCSGLYSIRCSYGDRWNFHDCFMALKNLYNVILFSISDLYFVTVYM